MCTSLGSRGGSASSLALLDLSQEQPGMGDRRAVVCGDGSIKQESHAVEMLIQDALLELGLTVTFRKLS